MPIADYPFIDIGGGGILRPMLPIKIINPHAGKQFTTYGLIDTGADACAIPASMANILGHNLLSGKTSQIFTGNGVTNAYAHTTSIGIFRVDAKGNVDTGRIVHTIGSVPINFMPNLHCVLLGMNNFLEDFVLTIDYKRKKFSIKNKI